MARRKPNPLVPATASEALAKWDGGGPVFTMEMGGLGPGYEQCIHVVVFELIRAFKDTKFPTDFEESVLNDRFNDEVGRIDTAHNLGLSGAQAGAAKWLAYQTLTHGWAAIVEKDKKRQIQVSKAWPSAQAVRS